MSITAICNQKGGCGKTVTAVNVAVSVAQRNKRTLLVDADFQGNASSSLGVKNSGILNGRTLSNALLTGKKLSDIVMPTNIENLDVIVGDLSLEKINREKILAPGNTLLFKKFLETAEEKYDHIFIDTHPSLDLVFQNVMVAAEYYFLPMFPEADSFEGLPIMFSEINTIKENMNPSLHFVGIVITKMKEKNATHKKFAKLLSEFALETLQSELLGIVPDSDAVAAASDMKKPLILYKPDLPVSRAIEQLVENLLPRLEKVRRGRPTKTPIVTEEFVRKIALADQSNQFADDVENADSWRRN